MKRVTLYEEREENAALHPMKIMRNRVGLDAKKETGIQCGHQRISDDGKGGTRVTRQ